MAELERVSGFSSRLLLPSVQERGAAWVQPPAPDTDPKEVNVPTENTAGSRATKENIGIRKPHARGRAAQEGRRCSCEPSFEAVVGLGKTGERRRKTFPTLA